MSLGKLLTTGKSLVGLHGATGRYQLRTGAMPKFESSKNPFLRPQAEPEPQLPKLSPAEVAAANMKKTQALLPVLGAVREVPKVSLETCEEARVSAEEKAKEAKAAEVPAAVDGWLKKLNPMVWLQNRKPVEAKRAVLRFSGSKTPVQGELSLDNIRVMRNDLSETDVEVVPAKAAPVATRAAREDARPIASANAAAAMAVPELPPATNAWEYLGERLLGKH